MKRPASVLVVLLSLPLALATQQGLSCVNDLVSNVNCTWKNRDRDGGQECWVSAETKVRSTEGAHTASCKLSSRPGPHCSMSFQPYDFHPLEVLPKINVTCGGALVDTVSHYTIKKHIQMNPPGEPSVSRMGNKTRVIWSPGYPLSQFITEFEFQVKLHQSHESGEDFQTLRAGNPELELEPWQVRGRCQVKVRVKAASYPDSIWSEWSPTTAWECSEPEQPIDQTQTMVWALMSTLLGVVFVAILVLCRHMRSLKMKPVPNPSKYFQTLHSVHSGNLKKWLNPHSTAASVFMAQHQENISPVEVCGLWPAARPTSPSISSTTALLSRSDVTTGSDTSGVVDSSSSSFSNMGYFLSSYGCRKTAANPLSFMRDFHHLQSHGRFPSHISLPFLDPPPHSCLRREVPAPDSGFSLGKESDGADGSARELLTRGSGSAHATLQGLLHSSSGEAQMEQPAEISSAAWPGGGPTCRASSMPVESSNPGYFTLKDIQEQLTFKNNSL
ncbi:interleukin-2 receptor subunit beta isoform 1-T2 [Synchiropus picturatus]